MTVVASNYARQANDLYQTEPWATEALLRHLPDDVLRRVTWEPFAGNHLMADVLREHGLAVVTSDITRYDRDHDAMHDFFGGGIRPALPVLPSDIISNPPYGDGNRLAERACRLSLRLCGGYVALLLTAKFDFGNTRVDLFRDHPRFWGKIALIDRIQWFPGDKQGTEDHAWYIWGPAPGHGCGKARLIYEGKQ